MGLSDTFDKLYYNLLFNFKSIVFIICTLLVSYTVYSINWRFNQVAQSNDKRINIFVDNFRSVKECTYNSKEPETKWTCDDAYFLFSKNGNYHFTLKQSVYSKPYGIDFNEKFYSIYLSNRYGVKQPTIVLDADILDRLLKWNHYLHPAIVDGDHDYNIVLDKEFWNGCLLDIYINKKLRNIVNFTFIIAYSSLVLFLFFRPVKTQKK